MINENEYKYLATSLVRWAANSIPASVKMKLSNLERDNRARTYKLLAYYKGDQMLYYLDHVIESAYADTVEQEQLKKRKDIMNIVPYVCSNVANVFKNGIQLEAINPADQDIYDYIFKVNNFDLLLKELEKLVFLVKTMFVKSIWDEVDECVKFSLISPHKVEVDTDDYDCTKLDKFSYILYDTIAKYNGNNYNLVPAASNDKLRFATWTKDNYYVYDINGKPIKSEDNIDFTNPYGVIPFNKFRDSYQYDNQYIEWPGNDIETVQDNINLHKTELNYLFALQSFSVPVLTNPVTNMYDRNTGQMNIPFGPGKPIILKSTDDNSPQPDFKYVTPQSSFKDLQEAINRDVETMLYLFGVNISELVPSAEKPSGESLQAASRLLDERRENKKLLYVNAIRDLFVTAKTIWNVENPGMQIKDDIKIEIMDSAVVKNFDERVKEYTFMLENNLTTIPDILMSERDDIENREEAKTIIEENVGINAELSLLMKNANTTNDSMFQDKSLSGDVNAETN